MSVDPAAFQSAFDAAAGGFELSSSLHFSDIILAKTLQGGIFTPEEIAELGNGNYIKDQAFIQAISLIHCDTAYSRDPRVNLAIASAIVIFNLAIFHHRFALEEKEMIAEKRLKVAGMVYRRALVMLNDVGYSLTSSSGHAVLDFVIMATHNNLAQISYDLVDYPTSRFHFERLLLFGDTVVPEYHDNATAEILCSHMASFLYNSFLRKQPPNAAASA